MALAGARRHQVAPCNLGIGRHYDRGSDDRRQIARGLVDRYTGAVFPEPGPNMVWNGRWGMMASMGAATSSDEAGAQHLAEQFLAGYLPGANVLEGTPFPGYYTFDYGRGQIEGMLSVNAATGEIWIHTWHGPALVNTEAATPAP